MESLDIMFKTGLYINDLSMHDSSRDLVLAGTQQSAELKLALDQVRYPFLLYWYARYVCVYAVFTCSPVTFHAHTFIGVCVDSITFKYVSHLNIDVVCESFVVRSPSC